MGRAAHPLSSASSAVTSLSCFHLSTSFPFENCSTRQTLVTHSQPLSAQGAGTRPTLPARTSHSVSHSGGGQKVCKGPRRDWQRSSERGALSLWDINTIQVWSCWRQLVYRESLPKNAVHVVRRPLKRWDRQTHPHTDTHIQTYTFTKTDRQTHTQVLNDTSWTLDPAQSEAKVNLPISWADNMPFTLKMTWMELLSLTGVLHEGFCSNPSMKWSFWPLTLGCCTNLAIPPLLYELVFLFTPMLGHSDQTVRF